MSKITAAPKHLRRFLKRLGPGLVTGAADDDPSGIATYSQAGSAFGFLPSWMMVVMLPMMTAVQEAAGRIGMVTGKGLSKILKENYSRWFLYFMVFFLVFANVVNIGADIGAMSAAAQLVIPMPYVWWTLFFTVGIVLLEVLVSYKHYAKILKWLSLSLFAYIFTAFVVNTPWGEVLQNVVVPHFQFDPPFIMIVVALFGTTISPYLFFWEPSQEVEEEIQHRWLAKSAGSEPVVTDRRLHQFRKDNFVGMFFSQAVAFFILITAAATLNKNGIFDIVSADQAARALEPLVGPFAKTVFALGIIGTGLLAIPVLAGSAAYAVSEALDMKEGLYQSVRRARGFYIIIAGATLTGLMINFVGIDPIKALVYAAVVNGIMAVPLIYMILRIGNNAKIMGSYTNGRWSNIFTILTLIAMSLAVLGMIFIH